MICDCTCDNNKNSTPRILKFHVEDLGVTYMDISTIVSVSENRMGNGGQELNIQVKMN